MHYGACLLEWPITTETLISWLDWQSCSCAYSFQTSQGMVRTISSAYRDLEITAVSCEGFFQTKSSTDIDTVAQEIGGSIIVNSALPARLPSETIDEAERIGNLGNLLEQMDNFLWMKELIVQITASVPIAPKLVKLVPSGERVEEISQLIADVRKGKAA